MGLEWLANRAIGAFVITARTGPAGDETHFCAQFLDTNEPHGFRGNESVGCVLA
jgi:hypothetical protein